MKTTVTTTANNGGTITIECNEAELQAMALHLSFGPTMAVVRSYVRHLGADPRQVEPPIIAFEQAGIKPDDDLIVSFGKNLLAQPNIQMAAQLMATVGPTPPTGEEG